MLRFSVADFLRALQRDQGGRSYAAVQQGLRRLCNTEFDLRESEQQWLTQPLQRQWRKIDEGGIEVELPDWLLHAITHKQVLSIHPGYFLLHQPLAKRLYELARKHCGR
ncbi:replication initiator protein A [Chromobacterium amazonense]|uniref:replication initiator protein A n=1 Tax=Chromobacterium amazonense TaxID=1382803 RepID=UPI003F7974C6